MRWQDPDYTACTAASDQSSGEVADHRAAGVGDAEFAGKQHDRRGGIRVAHHADQSSGRRRQGLANEPGFEMLTRFDVDGPDVVAAYPAPNENAWLLGQALLEVGLFPTQ